MYHMDELKISKNELEKYGAKASLILDYVRKNKSKDGWVCGKINILMDMFGWKYHVTQKHMKILIDKNVLEKTYIGEPYPTIYLREVK